MDMSFDILQFFLHTIIFILILLLFFYFFFIFYILFVIFICLQKQLETFFANDTSLNIDIINDLIIERLGLNYGKDNKNPVEDVTFYDKKRHNDNRLYLLILIYELFF